MTELRPSFHPDTLIVSAGRPREVASPINTGIYPASNYRLDAITGKGERSYARGDGNPGWQAFEDAMGQLEGGHAVAFSSGLAAIRSILDQLPTGAKILAPDDVYHGVAHILDEGIERLGWVVKRIPNPDTDRWCAALGDADLVWVESPSNPLMEVADVPAICARAKQAGVPVAVDNTFATPLLQRPLELGATFSVHSATKFIGGHSDLLAGVVVGSDEDSAQTIRQRRSTSGATPGALESFLALRGLRTLGVRLERCQGSAMLLAKRLGEHRLVTRVLYPGLESHPGHDLVAVNMDGPGSMLSFEVHGSGTSLDIRLSRLKLIVVATSLGGVETSLERRAKNAGQEHLPQTLIRMSVGLEHPDDIWADLEQALDGVGGE